MPPHDGHDHDHDDGGDGRAPRIDGLPVRHAVLRPGAVGTGAFLAAAFAVLAHVRSLFAGLVWDDRVFLLEDPRIRSLGGALRAFAEPFFSPDTAANEMYRPLVTASLAVDWFVSGSSPGDPTVAWFRVVNLLLHAANSALVYLLFANLTKRKLGAPLLAACLFAVHPLGVEPVTWIVGRCDLLAAFFGLLAAVLLLRSPGKPRLAAAAAACWGAGLFAKASVATIPLIVALGLVAYHEVAPRRFLTWRVARPFVLLAIPAAVWFAARVAVLGAPFPVEGGRAWHDVAAGDMLQGSGRAVWMGVANVALPARLCGDYSGDVCFRPQDAPWDASSVLGLAALAAAAVAGGVLLRRHAAGFPMLAWAVSLVPVLQIVPIGAIFADRFVYLPMAFALLLAAEGLEHLYYRWGALRGLSVTLVVLAVLPAMSFARGAAWTDETTFFRDAAAQYPDARDTRIRLALALSSGGGEAGRTEAKDMLRAAAARTERPRDELSLLGALDLEDGDLAAAERSLRAALAIPGGSRMTAVRLRYNLAVCLKRAGRRDEAREFADEALRLAPELDAVRTLAESLR